MRKRILITLAMGFCALVLTASCDDNKKKIAEQQAIIDSLQRLQNERLQDGNRQQTEEKDTVLEAEEKDDDLDTAELVALSEEPVKNNEPTMQNEEKEKEPAERAPLPDDENKEEIIVYCCSSDGFVNIRQQPTVQSAILGKLNAGGRGALVLDSSGKWWKVRDNNVVGYVHSSQITTDFARSKAAADKLARQSSKNTTNANKGTTYYVVIGSYSSLAEVKKVRLEADIFAGSPVYKTTQNGKTVYRICPFEFSTKAKADQYARDIKNSFWTDAWVWASNEKPQQVYKFPGLK